jgi:hypothetical protein
VAAPRLFRTPPIAALRTGSRGDSRLSQPRVASSHLLRPSFSVRGATLEVLPAQLVEALAADRDAFGAGEVAGDFTRHCPIPGACYVSLGVV